MSKKDTESETAMALKRNERLRVHLIGSDSVAYYRMDGSDVNKIPKTEALNGLDELMLGVVSVETYKASSVVGQARDVGLFLSGKSDPKTGKLKI